MSFYFISFLIVALGSSVPSLGAVSACIGFLLFWQSMLHENRRFYLAVAWFFFVQMVQLSWMTSDTYMGMGIWLVYSGLSFFLALQFGLFSLFFSSRIRSLPECFAMAGAFVLLEWTRLFICTGFTWNPIGLALASSQQAIQMASLLGVYGLSFWVIWVNAVGFYFLHNNPTRAKFSVWLFLVFFPYLFGGVQEALVRQWVPFERTCSVALVQTGILPEEKDFFLEKREAFIPPLEQWERIWEGLDRKGPFDFLVLPEAAVTLRVRHPFYPLEEVEASWRRFFGSQSLENFPPLCFPFAKKEGASWKVSNAFIAQALANHFQAELVAGFDDAERGANYNAAFYFKPFSLKIQRYAKQVLVPMGEYIPLSSWGWFSRFLQKQFGLGNSFKAGSVSKVFQAETPFSASVCVEETYSELIRGMRKKGARLFINVTNDIWFPCSPLPLVHLQHARLRSAENGVYSFRSCNSGVTGVIDCFGNVIHSLPIDESKVQVLYTNVPLRSFSTLYTQLGDFWILVGSGVLCLFRRRFY